MKHMQTPSQTVGPFFHYGLFTRANLNILVRDATEGKRILIKGLVIDGAGTPVPDAMLEIWQADSRGYFNHPADPNSAQADKSFRYFGHADTTNDGVYSFETVKPGVVPYNADYNQAPHINVRLFSRGLLTHAYTRLYFADETEANQNDPVLNLVPEMRRHTLIALTQETNGLTTYCFNIVLQGDNETVFFNP